MKHNEVQNEMIRLRLFSFSLRDAAKDRYDSLEFYFIPTWNDMVKLFLKKFLLPSEALKTQGEIIQFIIIKPL